MIRWLGFGLLCAALVGCGDDSGPTRDSGMVDAPDVSLPDVPTDVPPECEVDTDCDDGVACTRDICDERRLCQQILDRAFCDDGQFCNGLELCDPVRGCRPGPLETCNDFDVCTIDSCVEEDKLCRHDPRDFDEDGEADWFCEGGTDCDDADPRRGSTVNEICDDEEDNDCDEIVDEDDCGAPMHDVCEDALDVSAGGFFELTSSGAVADYSLGCAPAGRKDLVLTFTTTEARALTVRAENRNRSGNPAITYMALRTVCDDRDTEMQCAGSFPAQIRIASLEPGTYFILIGAVDGTVDVEVSLDDPTPPPTNESCDMPMDVSAGGTFAGSFVDVADDVTTSCGGTNAPDLTYEFTLTEERDVVFSALSATGDSVSVALSDECGSEEDELRCLRGSPASGRAHQLAPGTYYLVVEGSASREVDFTLDVAFEDPTPPPAGDVCANAIDLTVGTPFTGTLADKQDDLATDCGFFFRDAVHEFTIGSTSDVTIEADGGGPFMYMSVRTTCDDVDSRLRCDSGNPARASLRSLSAGTYYVVVESSSGVGYTLNVEASPPTPVTDVVGNGSCATAHVVPPTGGLFRGNTSTFLNDYNTRVCGSGAASRDAAFRLVLTSTSRVVASTEGSAFDTVLHRHEDACVSMGEEACDDDGGEGRTSVLDEVLDPGTYFYIVDGWGSTNAGEYFFEVAVSDP